LTLNQALAIVNARRTGGPAKVHFLVCGCQPLHLATFLKAHLLERLPNDSVEILTGLYAGFPGNLEMATNSPATSAAVVLEWSDIDPRLGLRGAGGWSNKSKEDILAACQERFLSLAPALQKLAAKMPVAIAPPTLPLPPIGSTIRIQAGTVELDLEQQLASFLFQVSQIPGVRIVNPSHIEQPAGAARLDPKMELLAGFPYSVPYTSALSRSLVDVLYQRQPKKGLITDLDETLWSGIVGEVGAGAVSWDQENHTQIHGLYQQMLGHLADCGVLLAVCSKNEPSVVEAAMSRKDLFIDSESLFPVCTGWGPKSESVAKVLGTWNIAEDAVVFVDDNALELSEVQQAFPGIMCLQFPGNDPAKVWKLLGDLRDLFGKPLLMEEDQLRRASIRASGQMREIGNPSDFLRGVQGTVTLDYRRNPIDKRPLELINKTNQFNLNGLRISEGDWQRCLGAGETIMTVVSYQDKFGPLGKIAVLLGARRGERVKVSHWVMSCRAFSRRIEHHTLDSLFRQTNASEIEFAFQPTERNAPLREYFKLMGVQQDNGAFRLSRSQFLAQCDVLPHQLSELFND